MQSEGLPLEDGEFVHASLDPHARPARRWQPEVLREHRDLAGAVVHPIELVGRRRHTPRARDHALDAHRVMLIAAWIALKVGDVWIPERHGARRSRDERYRQDQTTESMHWAACPLGTEMSCPGS